MKRKYNFNKYDYLTDQLTNKSAIRLVKYYKESLTKIQSLIESLQLKESTIATSQQLIRLNNLKLNIETIVTKLIYNTNSLIQNNLENTYKININSFQEILKKDLEINVSFGKVDERTVLKSFNNDLKLVKWKNLNEKQIIINKNTIVKELTKGLIEGSGYKKINKILSKKLSISTSKSMRILRTETHRIKAESRNESIKDVIKNNDDLNIRKVWISSIDARSRMMHVEMNGKLSDENGFFTLPDGVTCEQPGMTGHAEHDINCRCTSGVQLVKND